MGVRAALGHEHILPLARAGKPPGSLAGQLHGDIDERADIVVGRAEVDEARPQADATVDRRRRDPDPAVVLDRRARARRCGRSGRPPRRHGGTGRSRAAAARRGARASSCAADELVQQPRLAQVLLDRVTECLGAVGAKRKPELQARNGREYSSVMSTMCRPERSCGMYASSCANASTRSARRRTSSTPQALGRYSHLCASSVTESARSSPANSVPGRRRRRGRQAVGAVDVEPHTRVGAHVGQRVDRVDGARQRRARSRDDGDRDAPRRAVGRDRARRQLPARAAARRRSAARGRSPEPMPSSSAERSIE